jgi:hypothetical protein
MTFGVMKAHSSKSADLVGCVVQLQPNKSLQGTFDPSPIFAVAKAVAASNAPEFRRYVLQIGDEL